MRNFKLLISAVSMILVFGACQKDELTITLNQSGTLTVKVVDENKSPVDSAPILVYYGYGDSSPLYDELANSNGIWEGRLLQSTYTCYTTMKKGKISYVDSKSIQVIAEQNVTLELDPYNNVGDFVIKLFNPYEYDLTGFKAILVLNEEYYNFNSLKECISAAHFSMDNNSSNNIRFTQVPAGVEYRAIVYKDNESYGTAYVNTSKNEESTYSLEIYYYQ